MFQFFLNLLQWASNWMSSTLSHSSNYSTFPPWQSFPTHLPLLFLRPSDSFLLRLSLDNCAQVHDWQHEWEVDDGKHDGQDQVPHKHGSCEEATTAALVESDVSHEDGSSTYSDQL